MAAAAAAAATTTAAAAVAAAAETLFNHFFRLLAAVRSTPPKIEKNAKLNFFGNFFRGTSVTAVAASHTSGKKITPKKNRGAIFLRHPLRVIARLDESTVIFFVFFFRNFFLYFFVKSVNVHVSSRPSNVRP